MNPTVKNLIVHMAAGLLLVAAFIVGHRAGVTHERNRMLRFFGIKLPNKGGK